MSKPEKTLRVPDLQAKKARGEKITMLTAYSAWMARLLADSRAIDMLLVGDSLGMVELGYDSTLPVTMDDIVRYTRAVRTGAPNALIVADMPFLSHQLSPAQALRNAGRLIQEGGATAVKIEGGASIAPTVERIVSAGIPVMGHLGLTPQSIHVLGGFRRQAKQPEEQHRLLSDASALEAAGAFSLVLECVPAELGRSASQQLRIPVIGIGSGAAVRWTGPGHQRHSWAQRLRSSFRETVRIHRRRHLASRARICRRSTLRAVSSRQERIVRLPEVIAEPAALRHQLKSISAS